jgi:hypothetical protein
MLLDVALHSLICTPYPLTPTLSPWERELPCKLSRSSLLAVILRGVVR